MNQAINATDRGQWTFTLDGVTHFTGTYAEYEDYKHRTLQHSDAGQISAFTKETFTLCEGANGGRRLISDLDSIPPQMFPVNRQRIQPNGKR